jgi:hypothetical protein
MAAMEDVLIDTPKALDLIAVMLAPLMVDGAVSFGVLASEAMEPIGGSVPKLTVLILAAIKKSKSVEAARKVVEDADIKLSTLAPKKEALTKLLHDQV